MNSISNSYELFVFLKKQELLDDDLSNWWETNSLFDMFLGSILTQNTKWTNVLKSLENLRKLDLIDLESLASVDLDILVLAITPSGFKNQKSKRIKLICKNILDEFVDFENFFKSVDRNWLLSQKGIGNETADTILCYICKRDFMVVDKYTARLLERFGYEFDSYEELQNWLESGINENFDKIKKLYNHEISLNDIYARFHGKIIEYMKLNPR